jgi:hypothetical protein
LFCLSFSTLPFTFVLFVFLYFAFRLCFVCQTFSKSNYGRMKLV